MNHFEYRGGILCAEAVPLPRIAADAGTPCYVYSTATIERHYRVFTGAFTGTPPLVCYAVKANGNLGVIRTLAALGAGADVVSGGELARALAAGVAPAKIVFSGVGKTDAEIVAGLDAEILQFNVESVAELERIDLLARARDRSAPVAIRINPDVDAGTHDKIATGRAADKFGIPWPEAREAFRLAAKLDGVRPCGVAIHIGSQLTELAPFEAAFAFVAETCATLRGDGHDISRIDLGGGLGIPYRFGDDAEAPPSPEAYAAVVERATAHLGCETILEPGRLLLGNAGILLTRITAIKEAGGRTIAVVDAAMNDFLRPTLYEAYHEIVPVAEPAPEAAAEPADIVGPVCETGDYFARNRPMPPVRAGDLLAVLTAGAYGAVMASNYNTRPLPGEVMVNGDRHAVVRPRQSIAALLAAESVPDWLESGPSARGAA